MGVADVELLDIECGFFDFLCIDLLVDDEPLMPFGLDMLLMLPEPMLFEDIAPDPIDPDVPEFIDPDVPELMDPDPPELVDWAIAPVASATVAAQTSASLIITTLLGQTSRAKSRASSKAHVGSGEANK